MSSHHDDTLLQAIADLMGPPPSAESWANRPANSCSNVLRPAGQEGTIPPQGAAEYQSLFENAVCGIYRDRLDGTPVHANRALYSFNGYDTEDEYLAAVTRHGGGWYVDPDRANYFQHLLQTHGVVRDLVSEVYRHRTRERAWITENAWYVRNERGVPIYIEGTIQDATERVQALAEVERQASTDALTGAANRSSFMKVLHDAVGDANAAVALLTIDLDKFKEVNDLLGHGAGDVVLRTVASRIQKKTQGLKATIARLGGDEFAVLLQDLSSEGDASILAGAIVEALRHPISVEGHDVVIGVSVGIALCPQHTNHGKDLLTFADLALYDVKNTGRNDFKVFNVSMKVQYQRRKLIETELNVALRDGALELYYQPIVNAQQRRIVGFESLMRWNHPRRGIIPPNEFMIVAEEAGLMPLLGNWAIGEACRQAALLPEDVKIAVNVSPSQLRSPSTLQAVREGLSQSSLSPRRLTIELTEAAILGCESVVSHTINELLSIGVELALDDFGTGYSSLSYLQRYAFSEVKIDRSFVAGVWRKPINLAIVRGIITIAKNMNMDIVAEGIEDERQAATLAAEGCSHFQGYMFGRPLQFAEAVATVSAQRLRSVHPTPNLREERTVRRGSAW
jgi:diguanylate cyclase (GGDEF)-like protein